MDSVGNQQKTQVGVRFSRKDEMNKLVAALGTHIGLPYIIRCMKSHASCE